MKLPSTMWAEAVRHSVYILNQLPTRALSDQTPYEAWMESKSDIGHIKVFGCVAHMKIPSNKVSKLEDRSLKIINLGKEPGTKAYRLFDPSNNKLYVNRDVVFQEERTRDWENLGEKEINHAQEFVIPDEVTVDTQKTGSPRQGNHNDDTTEVVTPETRRPTKMVDPENYDDSVTSRNFRLIEDVYQETEEVKIEDELLLMGIDEPSLYSHAVKNKAWKQVMMSEMESIERNGTWELTDLPHGHKEIGLKWIFKLKKDANGNA